MTLNEKLEGINNLKCYEAVIKADMIVNRHYNIVVSVSGGSDSDVVIDMIQRVREPGKQIRFVYFDTGLEYQATKDHLDYLEQKYGITIERVKAKIPIPLCVKKHGQPFLSKYVSEQLSRLQMYNFGWEDFSTEAEMEEAYPDMPKTACKFWTDAHSKDQRSMFDISYHRDLKEFIIKNPPWFPISNKCCTYSKKAVAHKFREEAGADLEIIGVRKAEGGIRAANYKTCFDQGETMDRFRPVFWLSDADKKEYEKTFEIRHSDCYEKWGFTRTGCVGCPYNLKILKELEAVEQYEPKMAKACKNIFKDAYEYTQMYREYVGEKKSRAKYPEGQMSIFDMEEAEQ